MYYNEPVAQDYSGVWGTYASGGTHRAIDYPVPVGTRVRVAGPGKVTTAGWSLTGFGYHVRVLLDDGNTVIYGHLSKGSIRVSVGQRVARNQIIGLSGNTGNSTGPHLHMEVRHSSWLPLTSFNFTRTGTHQLVPYVPGPTTWTGL